MAFNYISAAEAASLIKHGYNIGLSGFTPATVSSHASKPSATVLLTQPTPISAKR